jgi:short subunit dehydrogenase-like uncharacterized protein
LSWGVAGRSAKKLESILEAMGKKANKDLSKIPIIIADVNDEKSLLEMAKRAKIVANCCGPYHHWGEQVVKACIEAGTHHVDVSGEPQYMESMQLKYNDQAREKGIYIVSSCAFESIPADMGTLFLQKKFEGTVNSVENFITLNTVDKNIKIGTNFGTWDSILNVFAYEDELKAIHRQLYPKLDLELSPKVDSHCLVHRSKVAGNRWCVFMPYPDQQVLKRTQRYIFEKEKQRPAQIRTYIGFDSFILAFLAAVGLFLLSVLFKFQFVRNLLLKYPEFFSLGIFSREGPKEEQNENLNFEIFCHGQGWKEKLAEPTDQFTTPINKRMTVKVSGNNPAYGATCVALLLAATTILKESAKMPEAGGVFPPGAAFKNTNLIEQLEKNGFKFEIVKTEEWKIKVERLFFW